MTKAADVLSQRHNGRSVAMMFIDGTGIGGPIVDRLQQLGFSRKVMEVQFGARPPDRKYANMRAFMWGRMRDWLRHGSIDDDTRLEQDVTAPGYQHDHAGPPRPRGQRADKKARAGLPGRWGCPGTHVCGPGAIQGTAARSTPAASPVRRPERESAAPREHGVDEVNDAATPTDQSVCGVRLHPVTLSGECKDVSLRGLLHPVVCRGCADGGDPAQARDGRR